MPQPAPLRGKLGQYSEKVGEPVKFKFKNVHIFGFCSRLLDALLASFKTDTIPTETRGRREAQ